MCRTASLACFRVCALVALLCLTPIVLAGKGDTLPHRLGVQVSYGAGGGPEAVRGEFQRVLADEISSDRCFEEIWRGTPKDPRDSDLVLTVTIGRITDTMNYELSLAERSNPDAPPGTDTRVVAYLEVELILELHTVTDGRLLRQGREQVGKSYRPSSGEDPRSTVRGEMIDAASLEVSAWVCKGNAKKMTRWIARARSGG